MTHGSLFSGIGGFDYASELMGWENKFHCEKDKFCNTILNYYWPNATSYEDIRETDFTIWGGQIDVLSGGFPCQPYSVAGKRKGKDDERHLWPEMLRAIREIQPRWVVGENVRGLINWNGGVVFDEVQADLEAEGYEVLPFILPAAGVNAPHRRDRVFFVAYAGGFNSPLPIQQRGQGQTKDINTDRENESGIVTNTADVGQKQSGIHGQGGQDLRTIIAGLLPTLAAQDGKNSTFPNSQKKRDTVPGAIMRDLPIGKNSQLSPLFVGDMMGFPVLWTLIPFLECSELNTQDNRQSDLQSGETKA